MALWNALWAANGIITGAVHPQGNVTGNLTDLYIRTTDGSLYRKLGGGATKFGWYLEPPFGAQNALGWMARGLPGGAGYARGINCVDAVFGASTLVDGPVFSGSGLAIDPLRSWVGGYTSGGATNGFIVAPNGVISSFPVFRTGAGMTAADSPPWDLTWQIVTTPRSNNAASVTTLAAIRIWAGAMLQSNTIQSQGGSVDSDLIYTAFNSLSLNNGMYGAFMRFSTAAADAGWSMVTANDNGAASSQTVTPMGVAVTADTIYTLRMRYQRRAGVPTILASVNDGTEIAIIGNAGPGTTPAGTVGDVFVPYLQVRALAAALKSICFTRMSLCFGPGCEA